MVPSFSFPFLFSFLFRIIVYILYLCVSTYLYFSYSFLFRGYIFADCRSGRSWKNFLFDNNFPTLQEKNSLSRSSPDTRDFAFLLFPYIVSRIIRSWIGIPHFPGTLHVYLSAPPFTPTFARLIPNQRARTV